MEQSVLYKVIRGPQALSAKKHFLVFLWFVEHQTTSYLDVADIFNVSLSILYEGLLPSVETGLHYSPQASEIEVNCITILSTFHRVGNGSVKDCLKLRVCGLPRWKWSTNIRHSPSRFSGEEFLPPCLLVLPTFLQLRC
uniref:Uncharacterized protein n=1 Tax=Timema tahoe TaxID=61484 RepID=A0A7R9IA68_9NEOP|nr:unnamed protein product [Timema tahoe]